MPFNSLDGGVVMFNPNVVMLAFTVAGMAVLVGLGAKRSDDDDSAEWLKSVEEDRSKVA